MLNVNKLWFLSLLTVIFIISIYFNFQINQIVSNFKKSEHIQQSRFNKDINFSKEKNTDDDLVVLYNRIPKTGSTSFVGVAYELCKKNAFKVVHLNITSNMHVMSLDNQYQFVHNVSKWDTIKPVLYHGHMAFLSFDRLGSNIKPIYVNIVRKPLDRLVSYYYFLRNGDNFRPHLIRRKHGDKMTFDECVEKSLPDCDPNNMWLQIPFFCGHAADCWVPGNPWALEQAKKNLLTNYLVVGLTEDMQDFITVLEYTLPRIFKGATQHYLNSNKSHLRQTSSKMVPQEKTVVKIQNSLIWKMENEFYESALEQFNFVKKKLLIGDDPNFVRQKFFYDKIRPK